MNQTQIIADVTARIRRPDLTADIAGAVRATIIEVHTSSRFPRDLVEEIVSITPTTNPKINFPTRFRDAQIVAPMTPEEQIILLPTRDGSYEEASPAEFMTPAGRTLTNIWYKAGTQLVVRSGIEVSKLYLLYYQNPNVTDVVLETWAMAADSDMFVYGALGRLYSTPLRQYELARENKDLFNSSLFRLTTEYSQ